MSAQNGLFTIYLLLGKIRIDQLAQRIDGGDFIGAITDDINCCAFRDAEGKNTEKAFCINLSLILFDPDTALKFVRFLY